MTTTFKPAKRENVPLLIGLDGPTQAGKTYTALILATAIAETIGKAQNREGRVYFIDTERGRALHYADDFTFQHGEIQPPFSPTAYGEAIDSAEKAGADVIVIDSFSHEWESEGGVKDMADRLEAGVPKPGIANPESWKRDHWITQPVKSPQNWTEPKGEHRRLVNKMLAARAHIIVCLRSQEKMRVETVPKLDANGEPKFWNGKPQTQMVITPAGDLPLLERWVPITEKGFPFEITTSFLLTPDAPGVPHVRKITKHIRPLVPLDRPIGRETGIALANWSMGGAARHAPQTAPDGTASTFKPDDARADIEGAQSLDELRSVWRTYSKQPWWSEVETLANERRAALTPPPEPEPQGEADYAGI